MKNIFVGNLPYATTEQELVDMFSQHGEVAKASIIIDRETGRSKGFGFVEMSTDEEAADAIEKFNGADYDGRAITVNEARPQAPRENRGGGGGGGYGQGNRDRGGNRGGFGGGRSRY